MSHTPYYYAPGGQYVLFLNLLGFTAFVRSSFQKKAEEADDREKEFELAQKQFKIAQAEVDREYRRFHEHLEELLRRPVRRGKSPAMSLVFSDCAYVIFERPKDAERFAVHAMRSFILNDMPGLRRTHSAARLRPLGASLARLQAAAAAAVLP
jgi:hypothetical protein